LQGRIRRVKETEMWEGKKEIREKGRKEIKV
jgi:hypothetical protein